LRNFGLKVGIVRTVKFEARIRELVENLPIWRCWSNRYSSSGGWETRAPPSGGRMSLAGRWMR
jgi:hypothetical protein